MTSDNQTTQPEHPGRTQAQRRAIDAIGCGNHAPIMSDKTRDSLLRDGLIERVGEPRIGKGAPTVTAQEYQMPIPVHMVWCAAVAKDEDGVNE